MLDDSRTAAAFYKIAAELGLIEKGTDMRGLEAKTETLRDTPLRAVIPFMFGKTASYQTATTMIATLNSALAGGVDAITKHLLT